MSDFSERELYLIARCGKAEAHIADLERELERLNGQVAEWSKANLAIVAKCVSETKRADTAERECAEMRRTLNRIARGAELQAHIMRDPLRTGGWAGAEKVADAFDDIAERARAALPDSANGPA